jgi:hypothetical protein
MAQLFSSARVWAVRGNLYGGSFYLWINFLFFSIFLKMESNANIPDQPLPESRKVVKRKIISLQTLLRARDMAPETKRSIEKNILELKKVLLSMNIVSREISTEEIEKRRSFVASNPGLSDIFQTIWAIFTKYTEDGFLSKEGYTKFNHAILIALGGAKSFEEVNSTIEHDWIFDKEVFGPLNRQGFCDLLFETIGILFPPILFLLILFFIFLIQTLGQK